MTGTEAAPWSRATSFSRVPLSAGSAPAAAACTTRVTAVSRVRAVMSEHLVQDADEPPRLQVVLHQALPEVADAELSNGGREHGVGGTDVSCADDPGQHDDLTVAIDLDFANAFDHEV